MRGHARPDRVPGSTMKFTPAQLNPLNLTRILRSRSAAPRKAPALPPGSLVHVGEQRVDEPGIRVISFGSDGAEVAHAHSGAEAARRAEESAAAGRTTWIQVTGLHDVDTVAQLGEAFGLHPLMLEDILNTESHAKVEISPGSIFVITRLMSIDPASRQADIQHVAVLLLPGGVVVLFLEAETPVFDPVHRRIEGGSGFIRSGKADYLAWALLDAIFDNYLAVIDGIDEELLALEDRLTEEPAEVDVAEIHFAKREIAALHRTVRPTREIAAALLRADSPLLSEQVRPFLHDLHDHAFHIVVRSEDLRDTGASIRDFYLATVSNRMNEVMKILTAIATIFLPLTFLAGVYGMNFEHMPELAKPWGYPVLWLVFLLIAFGMALWFRRLRWF